jgi:hypothetical protein
MNMSTVLAKYYHVIPAQDVSFKLSIGFGQKSTTSINLNDLSFITNQIGEINLPLGKGDALKGKTLYVTTTVSDVQPNTNETSVTYQLEGGIAPYKNTLQETAPKPNDVVFYTATFVFF